MSCLIVDELGGEEAKMTELAEISGMKVGLGFSSSWERDPKVPANKHFELLYHDHLCIRER